MEVNARFELPDVQSLWDRSEIRLFGNVRRTKGNVERWLVAV